MSVTISISAVCGVPDIKPGNDLAQILGDCLEFHAGGPRDGDILCIAHKVFSKAEGNVIRLDDVVPSENAYTLGEELNKDPRKVEVILQESARVVKHWKRPDQDQGVMICEHKLGFTSANAAVDESNTEANDTVITLPEDPDASVKNLCKRLESRFGKQLGVVMTDTFGRPWRLGQVNVAIGLAMVPAITSEVGKNDAWGRPLFVTEPALADEISAASGLVVQKAAKTPLVLFRGLAWARDSESSAKKILRRKEENMF